MSLAQLIELIKYAGFPALVFMIWYLYHEAQVKAFGENMKLQVQVFQTISSGQSKREDQNYELLKEMLEISRYQAAILARMDNKIDTNQFCPLIKDKQTA
jgi:hypothetical protein